MTTAEGQTCMVCSKCCCQYSALALWALYTSLFCLSSVHINFSLNIVSQEVKNNKIHENGDKNENIINDIILT